MSSPTAESQSLFVRITDIIDTELERHFWRWSALIVLVFMACMFVRDIRDKMWLDELFTTYMARQADPAEIIRATIEGSDGAPPLYAIIVHSILPVVKNEALATRLPSTLGYCGMVLCLLAFCRRRMPAVYALATGVVACDVSRYYATEGRPYGLMLLCGAGALLTWQAAVLGRRRWASIAGLAICLAAMVALHYHAIFFCGALAVGEWMRWRKSGKLDFAVIGAMACAPAVLALHYPFIAAFKKFQLHYWSPASWVQIRDFYNQDYFRPLALLVLTAAVIFAVLAEDRRAAEETLPSHEWGVGVTLAFMPVLVVAVSKYTTHAFVDRYVLWACMGLALLSGGLLCASARRQTRAGTVVLVLLVALLARHSVEHLRATPTMRAGEPELRDLNKLPNSSEPIVVGDNFAYMELAYYAKPALRQRLIYPLDAGLELSDKGFDTVALMMSALSHRSTLRISPYDSVLASYPRFILSAGQTDPFPKHLLAAGYRLTWIAPTVYEAEAPKKN